MPSLPAPRLAPQFAFPNYAYLPGVNAPYLFLYSGQNTLDLDTPANSEGLCYAIDLYNYGYFWETHVCLEALWIAQGRTGLVADFLKALIHCAAAGLKMRLKRHKSARGHLLRSRELIHKIQSLPETFLLGFDLNALIQQLDLSLDLPVPDLINWTPEWVK